MNITKRYLRVMETKQSPFSIALRHLLGTTKSMTQGKVAEKAGVQQSYISARVAAGIRNCIIYIRSVKSFFLKRPFRQSEGLFFY